MTKKTLFNLMFSTERKQAYIDALTGLKMQASAVTKAFPNNPDKNELMSAQELMSKNDTECKHIAQLVLKPEFGISIPDLTKDQLFEWLELEYVKQVQDQEQFESEE